MVTDERPLWAHFWDRIQPKESFVTGRYQDCQLIRADKAQSLSNRIETRMEALELIGIVQQVALNGFAHAIFPVYKFDETADPVHIGTCFAFEHRGRRFLVTAAHVLDHKKQGPLGFASTAEKNPVQIVGEWHVVSPGHKPREEDPFDFAWHELTADEIAVVPCIAAVGLEDTQSPAVGLWLLTTIGFPVSKNKKISPDDRRKRRLSPKRAQYSNTELTPDEYYKARGMSSRTHVAMKREKRSIDSDGLEVNTIGHHGFSGGPLIYTGLTNSPVLIGDQKVVGLILEGDEEAGVLVALRISVVLRHIDSQIAAAV